MSGCIPKEFARQSTRSLYELARFKATELHFILHHAGPVIFKGILPEPLYQHFLLLHFSVRLLSDETLFSAEGVVPLCEGLLKRYVEDAITLYGPHFISFNVHNVIHSPADVEYFNRPLYDFSCYAPENRLQMIKKLVVSHSHMLEQAVKRVDEINRNSIQGPSVNIFREPFSYPTLHDPHYYGPIIHPLIGQQYRKLLCGSIELTTLAPNNIIRIRESNVIFKIKNFMKTIGGDIILIGKRFQICSPYFEIYDDQGRPRANSAMIGTWKVSRLTRQLFYYRIQDVKCKCVQLPDLSSQGNEFSVVSPVPLYSTLT